jgi:acyl carrier protein
MNDKITQIVIDAVRGLNDELHVAELNNPTRETRIYGPKAHLDSVSLVMLVADIERRVAESLGVEIVLADERAVSLTRSPFRTVESLASYIETIIQEKTPK